MIFTHSSKAHFDYSHGPYIRPFTIRYDITIEGYPAILDAKERVVAISGWHGTAEQILSLLNGEEQE